MEVEAQENPVQPCWGGGVCSDCPMGNFPWRQTYQHQRLRGAPQMTEGKWWPASLVWEHRRVQTRDLQKPFQRVLLGYGVLKWHCKGDHTKRSY